MDESIKKPQRSLWDREPADIQNTPPIYQTQDYDTKVPPPVYMANDGKRDQPEVVYVEERPMEKAGQVEKKHNDDDLALGCGAGCLAAVCCCGCVVM
ncbi:hypothetical protein CJF32_00004225 [Rutstroemia sp. NJR-2017a WRK4]|nr:hypothetical protein CJF32_00004225 [Rutstroemia sp. NJR-2017a WRK4]